MTYAEVVRRHHPNQTPVIWRQLPTKKGYKIVYTIPPDSTELVLFIDPETKAIIP